MRKIDRPSRLTPETLATIANRITARDHTMLETIWQHRVLTTAQLTAIFFPSRTRANQRLLELYRCSVLQRFRPWSPIGSQPWHWVLGPAGAHLLAARHGQTIREFGYKAERTLAICWSDKLGHQLGTNQFFADLHAHARQRQDGTRLDQWWPEQRCLDTWKGLARPDAFGRWIEIQEDGRTATMEFFLEHDTGTNPLNRLTKKLDGYKVLAESTKITTPILFWLPSTARETNLRRFLTTTPLPVATAVHTPPHSGSGPAGPIWLPVGTKGPRRRLAVLGDAWGGYSIPPDTTRPGEG
jgi:hypothetical protein